jgi:guanine nucleotide-binding protein subunit alpha
MNESLNSFKDIVQEGRWRERCPIVLCFTKMDLFENKIIAAKRPVCDYFLEYTGEQTDVAAAQAFFTKKFQELDKGNRISSIHYLNVFDADNVRKLAEDLKGIIPRFWRQRDYETAITVGY